MNFAQGVLVGKILATRAAMLDMQQLIKQTCRNALRELERAKTTYSQFGMYDDCGPSYLSDLEQAEAKVEFHKVLVPQLISIQKYLKSLKKEYQTLYTDDRSVLENELKIQTATRESKVAKQNRAKKEAIKEQQRELNRKQLEAKTKE